MSVHIGIIGGSGLYDMAALTDRDEKTIPTPFGDPSGPYVIGTLGGKRVAFLARHGVGHRILPSELNFRANIYGFKLLGVERILSASAVGSRTSPSRIRSAPCCRTSSRSPRRPSVPRCIAAAST
jgi:5'-methylthioadenosine phosphorylase